MDPSLQPLLSRLGNLSGQFQELRVGVHEAIRIADISPEMALTRSRKVLEYLVREVYERRINEPPGTRPLENLLQRLVKDGFFPDRLDAYANTIRKLGNVGTHTFGEKLAVADVYQSLAQLLPILEWYFEVERPEALDGQPQALPVSRPLPSATMAARPKEASVAAASASSHIAIVPKGLRSFDAHDAEFFLDLLPGPRHQDGLPQSIRFWKHRIEDDDEATFTVGVLYGPSGCGKSSLVKAGLLPRLASRVLTVYVEATANETDARLLKGLRKQCPDLSADLGIKETLAALRCGQGIPRGKKILIIVDQFEQWLHARRGEQDSELAQALRQCDGQHVQCLVLVRDDFWLALCRFMGDLHIELVQGQNIALVDLFDPPHAQCAGGLRPSFWAVGRPIVERAENISRSNRCRAVPGWPGHFGSAGAVCGNGQSQAVDARHLKSRRRHHGRRRVVPGRNLLFRRGRPEAPLAPGRYQGGAQSPLAGTGNEYQGPHAVVPMSCWRRRDMARVPKTSRNCSTFSMASCG